HRWGGSWDQKALLAKSRVRTPKSEMGNITTEGTVNRDPAVSNRQSAIMLLHGEYGNSRQSAVGCMRCGIPSIPVCEREVSRQRADPDHLF
ncbi:MAG: hypothetical protein MUE60_10185, partial [Candidatus Eisenbacteria bacterium]|nr:hypothetical protein [Candidatus Eisenbacteria bacterium]